MHVAILLLFPFNTTGPSPPQPNASAHGSGRRIREGRREEFCCVWENYIFLQMVLLFCVLVNDSLIAVVLPL